jgi:acetyl-CoA acyltransferase
MQPAFKPDGGVVTAATSSPLNDGAAVSLLMSRQKADALGLSYTLKYAGGAMAGIDPTIMGMGPVPAVQKLLKLTGTSIDQIDVVEINEAFASQSVYCVNELGLDPAKTNVNGGAIATGHPLGATGGVLTVKILGELSRTGGKRGIVTMCIGGGMGFAYLLEMA